MRMKGIIKKEVLQRFIDEKACSVSFYDINGAYMDIPSRQIPEDMTEWVSFDFFNYSNSKPNITVQDCHGAVPLCIVDSDGKMARRIESYDELVTRLVAVSLEGKKF